MACEQDVVLCVMTDVATASQSICLWHVCINTSSGVKSRYEAVNIFLLLCCCRRAEPKRVSHAENVGHVVALVRGGQRSSEQQRNSASDTTQRYLQLNTVHQF